MTISVVASVTVLVATLYGGWVTDFLNQDAQTADASKVVNRFMALMSAKDLVAAETLFSEDTNPDEVHRGILLFAGEGNRVLFDGYRSLKVEAHHVTHLQGYITNSHLIDLVGTVQYVERPDARFTAQLVKESGNWALLGVFVTPPNNGAATR